MSCGSEVTRPGPLVGHRSAEDTPLAARPSWCVSAAAKHAAFRVQRWNYSQGYPKCCCHLGFRGKPTQRKLAAPSTHPSRAAPVLGQRMGRRCQPRAACSILALWPLLTRCSSNSPLAGYPAQPILPRWHLSQGEARALPGEAERLSVQSADVFLCSNQAISLV